MAIQFARAEYISRSTGGNACRKGAYNARISIRDERVNVLYNFSNRSDNVYHNIILPDYVNLKFKDLSILMNTIERAERKSNSQLLKEYVLALPDEDNISLELKKEMIDEFIHRNKWISEGLGVQIDIHAPHDGENNWHVHLLITTRRFLDNGLGFEIKKARDLAPQVGGGRSNTYVKSNNELNIGKLWAEVQNDKFKEHNLLNRVDSIGIIAQEHIGPVRMRSVLNQAAERNEERYLAEIEHLNCGSRVLDKVTRHMSVFTKGDLIRAVKYVPDLETRGRLVEDALANKSVIGLYQEDGKFTEYYTTSAVRAEDITA